MGTHNHDSKVKEVIEVRGIAAAIQAMAAPTFNNLDDMLKKLGWKLIRDSKHQTNKQNEQ